MGSLDEKEFDRGKISYCDQIYSYSVVQNDNVNFFVMQKWFQRK